VGRLDFDDIRAEVGQDRRRTGTRDEAGQVYHLQTGKYVFICHANLLSYEFLPSSRSRQSKDTDERTSRPPSRILHGLIVPETAAHVLPEKRWCLPSCLPSLHKSQIAMPRSEDLPKRSRPTLYSPHRSRTSRPAEHWS